MMNLEDPHVSDILSKIEAQNILNDPASYLQETDGIKQHDLDIVDFINGADHPEFVDHQHFMEEQDSKNFSHALPPPALQNISNEEYSGPFEFEVSIIPNSNGSKNPWEYSTKLNKIFVDMGNAIPVDFCVKTRPEEQLYVRATPKFSQHQHHNENVYRCINHEHRNDPSNKDLDPHQCQHIIRCYNQQAWYIGHKMKNERLSVMVPLAHPQAGMESVREMYTFVCKSSCPGGMNRRPIDIIFTLENYHGDIYGRRAISVRICSCPKRDKGKEEQEVEKNKITGHGKKRKREDKQKSLPNDQKEYVVNNFKVIGIQNYRHMLQTVLHAMSSEVLEITENGRNGDPTPYRNCINDIKSRLSEL